MSDDEVIKFEITDYDLNNEFNTQHQHRNRRGTKEQQTYGIWAQDSDDEEEVDRRKKPRDRRLKESGPIGFVSGGVQQSSEKKQEKDVEVKDEPDYKPAPDSSDEEEETNQIPGENETAGLRRRGFGLVNKTPKLGGNVGNWERHTKGIGAKLLLQMGYQPGKGLGRALQGISAPVEAAVRKGRGAIGAYGPEKAAMKIKKEEAARAVKEKEETPKKTGNWKKTHKGRYFYRDALDVIQEGKPMSTHTESSAALARVPVIDMTGRGKVVLSGYHALRSARGAHDFTDEGPTTRYEDLPRKDCRNFSVPELLHNLELLVDCCEQDIIQNARAGQTAEDEEVALQKDLQDLELELNTQDKNVKTMDALLKKLENLHRPDLTFEDAYMGFTDLKINHPAEYEAFALGTVFESVVGPIITPLMSAWNPLEKPSEPIPVFIKCRELMTPDTYHSLLWQQFVIYVKKAAQEWNPRQPQSLLDVYSAWSEVAPTWLVKHALASSAAPRLATAAKEWDPTKDPQPLHEWVLPWDAIAGVELTVSVYPVLREKLSTALAGWHPSDGSARPLLEPWRQAWGASLVALVNQDIMPKLDACLIAEPIDLASGKSLAWSWCTEWSSVCGWPALAALAARSLLPRWLAALAAWLNTSPPHANVLASYTAWKAMIPDEVHREPAIRDIFRKALDMMHRSTDMEVTVPVPLPVPSRVEAVDVRAISEIMASANQQKTFMELLESKCSKNGIPLVPIPGRMREGRPVFKIGIQLQCYVIRNVVMYSGDLGRTFQPISLESLLHSAATQ